MKGKPSSISFGLPPRANEAAHARVLARLKKMTPEELFQSLVRSGIYTSDGKLTEHYAVGAEKIRRNNK